MNDTTDATAIFAPIWRRKWLILTIAALVAIGSYFYYKHQPATFQATTELYLGAGAEEQFSERGLSTKSTTIDAATQPELINALVVEIVRQRLRKEHSHIAKLAAKGKVRAKATEKSQFVTITTEARNAKAAALLANTVATTYIKRQHAQFERGVKKSISIARRQQRRIEIPRAASKGKGGSKTTGLSTSAEIQAASLSTKINQLESLLTVTGVQQTKVAKPHAAVLLSPKPKKNAEFGFVIGLLLASIAAFILSRFNRRLRTVADIESVLQAQILTALPHVKRPIIHRDGEPTPSKPLIEPLRRLHTTLQLQGAGNHANGATAHRKGPRSILVVSPDAGDGASTLIADLALVQSEAGERTAIVEADFRRPVQGRLLGVTGAQGLAEVLMGTAALAEVMQEVPLPVAQALVNQPAEAAGVATALAGPGPGGVSLLVSGSAAANPPALLASAGMAEVLRSVGEDYDRVLIDAPSPLEVSDVMPLLGVVDAIVLVARASHTHESSARSLRELLARTPTAPVLGAVANAASAKDIAKHGISSGQSIQRWPGRLMRR
ncbi:MAG TPA: Wzz/FepE/Etk N-terminal domain-containing protein [Solirubrobacteraceae bacterium]|jgi:Mrp family chromosome partitioning ATPase|nr:Wzz/FepE/Etk N-terminal domain-containing protein [Solirubrobacteraceae bacterium]